MAPKLCTPFGRFCAAPSGDDAAGVWVYRRGVTVHRSSGVVTRIEVGWAVAMLVGQLLLLRYASSAWPDLGVWSVIIVIVGSLATVFRRHAPATLAVCEGLAMNIVPVVGSTVLAFHAGGRFGRRSAALQSLAAVATGVAVTQVVEDGPSGLIRAGIITAAIALPMALGAYAAARVALRQEIQARQARELSDRQRELQRAVMDERSRLARELHDVIAHRVSLMVLRSNTIEVNQDASVELVEEGRLIARLGRMALEELTEMLGVLRDPEHVPTRPLPGISDIPELVSTGRQDGLVVTYAEDGVIDVPDGHTARAAYRLVQEGLTNCHKHAPGANVEVATAINDDVFEVAVVNSRPSEQPAPIPSAGLGLIGLRERAAQLGGTLHAGATPDGGWELRLRVPLRSCGQE